MSELTFYDWIDEHKLIHIMFMEIKYTLLSSSSPKHLPFWDRQLTFFMLAVAVLSTGVVVGGWAPEAAAGGSCSNSIK